MDQGADRAQGGKLTSGGESQCQKHEIVRGHPLPRSRSLLSSVPSLVLQAAALSAGGAEGPLRRLCSGRPGTPLGVHSPTSTLQRWAYIMSEGETRSWQEAKLGFQQLSVAKALAFSLTSYRHFIIHRSGEKRVMNLAYHLVVNLVSAISSPTPFPSPEYWEVHLRHYKTLFVNNRVYL